MSVLLVGVDCMVIVKWTIPHYAPWKVAYHHHWHETINNGLAVYIDIELADLILILSGSVQFCTPSIMVR